MRLTLLAAGVTGLLSAAAPSCRLLLVARAALLAARAVAPNEWWRLAQRKLAQLDEQIAKAQTARVAIEHALRCPHEDIPQCPTSAA